MDEQPKNEFIRIAVTKPIKREIDILAAMEQRNVYEIVADMVNAYKAISVEQLPRPTGGRRVPVVNIRKAHADI